MFKVLRMRFSEEEGKKEVTLILDLSKYSDIRTSVFGDFSY